MYNCFQEAAFFEEMSQQTTMYPGACGQIPTFSPTRKMNSTRSIDSESPITDFTDEELFHLEMSDEGSGGKRSRLGKYSIFKQISLEIFVSEVNKVYSNFCSNSKNVLQNFSS